MSTVQIGGQDFILAGSNPLTIVASSYADFVVDALIPRDVWGENISLHSAERRGDVLQARRLVASARAISFINFDDTDMRSSKYRIIDLLVMGPFRPKPKPTTGYVYPRRLA